MAPIENPPTLIHHLEVRQEDSRIYELQIETEGLTERFRFHLTLPQLRKLLGKCNVALGSHKGPLGVVF